MLLGLDADGVADAIGIAASMGAGLLEANRTGGTVKRAHCGWAAHAGVCAAELARSGLTGPPTVLEGRFGFFQAYCGDAVTPETIVDGLGEHWEVLSVFFKPYPCNHFTHPGIDAALQLRSEGLEPNAIAEIELGAPTGSPAHDRRTLRGEDPAARSGYHAKFSGPFTVAAALLGGGGLGSTSTTSRTSGPGTRSCSSWPRVFAASQTRSAIGSSRCASLPACAYACTRERCSNASWRRVEAVPSSRCPTTSSGRKFELNASRALASRVDELRELVERFDSLDSVRRLGLSP